MTLRRNALSLTAVFLLPAAAAAMPNFARREGVDCTACHSTIPMLNRAGFEYRNSGFRFPSNIGKSPEKTDFDGMNGARIQSLAQYTRSDTKGKATDRAVLNFLEVTLYPVTGAFGKHFSSLGEFSAGPDDFLEVENAYVRGVFGNETSHFNARLGVYHPWEGFGASDRPVGLARPLLQTKAASDPASGTGSTFFTAWGLDQIGAEVGYTWNGFNIAGSLLNGAFVAPDDAGKLGVHPFQGGGLSRASGDPSFNQKDFQVFANQFLGERAAVSAYYYFGSLTVPDSKGAFRFTDDFHRAALYGTVPLASKLSLFAGVQGGWDSKFNAASGRTSGDFFSLGGFGQAYVYYNEYLGGGLRYDYFAPSTEARHDEIHQATFSVNAAALNGAQAILEYAFADTNPGKSSQILDNRLQLRVIYIF